MDMKNSNINLKKNIRYSSIRKKTASRICSTQVLYGASFLNSDIKYVIQTYKDNYLEKMLSDIGIKNIDEDLFHKILNGVYDMNNEIDEIISSNLAKNWTLDRLSRTEKSVLRLATFELCFDDEFKKLTIINEYISIIEVFGGNANFANAILDNIST